MELLLIVMFRFVIRESLGWWASARTPPTTMAPAELRANTDRVTVMELAPRPTPEAWALGSLPMPRAVCPRLVNWSLSNVMLLAAETWTAAGIWLHCGRVASNCTQPEVHDPKVGHDQLPPM